MWPRNVEVTEPIRVTYRVPQAGAAIFPRTLVIAEANSHVTVIEEFTSGPLDGQALVIPVGEIWANDGAHVRFMSLQTLDPHATLLGAQTAIVERDANIFWMSGAVGADVQHMDMAVRLQAMARRSTGSASPSPPASKICCGHPRLTMLA